MAFDPNFNNGDADYARYIDGVHASIKRNAQKGAFKRWIAEAEDHKQLYDWLMEIREFQPTGEPYEEDGITSLRYKMHPLVELKPTGSFGHFLNDLGKVIEEWGKLSPKQTAIVRKSFQQAKERLLKRDEREAQWKKEAANLPPVPVTDERIDIVAEILTVKEVENDYGLQLKALFKTDAGYKLWGSIPRAIHDAEKGDRVQFTARVKPSEDDPAFGFINRPTKSKMISRANG